MFLKKTLLKKPGTSIFYTPADLYIGQTVDIFGRTFFIYDADGFTTNWCDDTFGPRDWTPINVDDRDGYYDPRSTVPPPYNGWGDEQDSLGYCYSLHPAPPKKNIQRMLDNQGQVLRFVAHFEHPAPQDAGRVFVVMFDLADDQISVFEKPRRNSGFKEGKFIQKAKITNPVTGQYFRAGDIRVGEVLTINGHQFRITGADEFALSRMEAEAEEFPQSDLNGIVNWLKRDGVKLAALRKKFEALDPDGTGFVQPDAAKIRIIRVFGMPEHDALTIVRRFTEGGGFDYYALQAAIA
jgi:hypothetical protein